MDSLPTPEIGVLWEQAMWGIHAAWTEVPQPQRRDWGPLWCVWGGEGGAGLGNVWPEGRRSPENPLAWSCQGIRASY